MLCRPRLIPCLSIIDRGLVKTTKFADPCYLGDPINAIKIFNNKGVDELCILDIRATQKNQGPDFEHLKDMASEAFVPLSYGGGITTMQQIEKLFYIGYEKIILNTAAFQNPQLVTQAAKQAGSQSIVVSIDVKSDIFREKVCFTVCGTQKTKTHPVEMAKQAEQLGAGEILLTSIDQDGTMAGYDIELIRQVSQAVCVPVIACGGAKDIYDLKKVLTDGNAHAAAASSMFVYYGRKKAVLITVPSEVELEEIGIYKNYDRR